MIIVHHLNRSRSQRILWLMEELGVEYEIKSYERNKKTMLAPPELKAIHPLGKSPVITDGNITVAESGAIIEYLVEKYGKLKPNAGSAEARKFTYWMHFAEGSGMPFLLMTLVFNKIESAPVPFFVKPVLKLISGKVKSDFINPNLVCHFAFIESELKKSDWFAGAEFSAADIQMSYVMEGGKVRGDLLGPKSRAWLERIHQRPAYKKAEARGGDFSLLS